MVPKGSTERREMQAEHSRDSPRKTGLQEELLVGGEPKGPRDLDTPPQGWGDRERVR